MTKDEKRIFLFDRVDATLSEQMQRAYHATLKRNRDQFNKDTEEWGYRPDRVTTLHF